MGGGAGWLARRFPQSAGNWSATFSGVDQALCAEPDSAAIPDQPMCAQPDDNRLTVMLAAQWLIANTQKLRLDAHRLIVSLEDPHDDPHSARSSPARRDPGHGQRPLNEVL